MISNVEEATGPDLNIGEDFFQGILQVIYCGMFCVKSAIRSQPTNQPYWGMCLTIPVELMLRICTLAVLTDDGWFRFVFHNCGQFARVWVSFFVSSYTLCGSVVCS